MVVGVLLKMLDLQLQLVVLVVVHNLEVGQLLQMVDLVEVVEVSLSMDPLMVEVVEALVLTIQVVAALADLEKVDL